MIRGRFKFKFDVKGEIEKLKLAIANPANFANRVATNDGSKEEISRISGISNAPIKNREIESIESMIAKLSIFYSYSAEDIQEARSAAINDIIGVTNALREQVEDIESLESENLSWRDVPDEFAKLVDKLCAVKKYSASRKEELVVAMKNMSVAQMLREIKILRLEI